MGYQNHRHCGCQKKKKCHCSQGAKEIVYPTRERVVHCCSEEVVRHVHPIHTTVVNHHKIRNEHVYPTSTSEVEEVEEYNVGKKNEDEMMPNKDYCQGKGRRKCGCRHKCNCSNHRHHHHHHHRRRRGFW